jgi:Flp pilus assembly protein TadD
MEYRHESVRTAHEGASSIGNYTLRKRLGEGGFGWVYEARDELLQREVALKCLAARGTAHGEQLIREARVAASLHHPAFVKVFGFEDDGQTQFIVMELVRGHTLHEHVAACVADPARALDVVEQVAAAMAQAHAATLIHGDLKPGNLMVEPGGAVRILDFGLARHVDPLATQADAPEDPLGTLAYMAPERLAGLPPSAASDIYALGVVLYQLVVGVRPYAGLHGLALASAHMHTSSQQWEYPRAADPGLVHLILAMTARDPKARPASMEEVRARAAGLRGALAGQASAPPASVTSKTVAEARIPPRRRRLRSGVRPLLAAGLLAAAAAGASAMLAAFPSWHTQAVPYSESASLRAGMSALRRADSDGQIEQALASFGAILAHTPDNAAAAAGQSLAYSMRYVGDGRDEVWLMKSASAAALAVQENDQLALAHAAQSWAAGLQGRSSAALAAADRALELDPSDTWALTSKINVLLRLQRQSEAATLIARARQRWPNERAFTDLEGTLLLQRSDYAGAERAFRRSVALEPDAVRPYSNLSAALLREGRGDESLAVLQQGLRVQPSGTLYSNLGTALFYRGDFVGASTAFQHALSAAKGGPNDYLKWANLADALRWIPGRERDAQAAYRRAMQLLRPLLARAPGDATFLSRQALYAAHVGDGAAVGWAERGAAAAPTNPDVRFRAAVANELSGRRSAALEQLAQAIALGYPFSYVESEPELVALRRDARYQTLAIEHHQ